MNVLFINASQVIDELRELRRTYATLHLTCVLLLFFSSSFYITISLEVSDPCFYSEGSIGQNLSVRTPHGHLYTLYSI